MIKRFLNFTNKWFASIKYRLGNIADSNVFISYFIYWLLTKITFLLPHDRSYYVFRHFFTSHPNGMFLDIGANNGISALSFRRLNKNYKIFSLEPNISHKKSLERIKKKDINFDYRLCAAGSKEEELTMFVPYYFGLALHTGTSCDKSFLLEQVKSLRINTQKIKIREYKVKSITIDSLNLLPDMIKIDCEGYDLAILEGAIQTIRKSQPIILMEYSSDIIGGDYDTKLNLILNNCEYRKYYFNPNTEKINKWHQKYYKSKTGNRNIVLIPQSRLHEIPANVLYPNI